METVKFSFGHQDYKSFALAMILHEDYFEEIRRL